MKQRIGKFVNLSGQKFGRLICLNLAEPSRFKGKTYWTCRCDCGKTKDVVAQRLVDKRTTSCGCFRQELYKQLKPPIHRKLMPSQINQICLRLKEGETAKTIAGSFNISLSTITKIKQKFINTY